MRLRRERNMGALLQGVQGRARERWTHLLVCFNMWSTVAALLELLQKDKSPKRAERNSCRDRGCF